ncbi:class I SAM-dependent methyltransferase [Parasphingorhabdus sp.]
MQIDWKLKSFLYSVLGHLPSGTLYAVQRYVTGRSKVRATAISPNWLFHEENLINSGSKRLIEFGAGKSLIQNIYLSKLSIEQTLVDLFRMVDIDQVNDAIAALIALDVDIDGRPVNSLEDLKNFYGIDYRAPVDMRNTKFESDRFDICISTNTLEHISEPDIRAILAELFRILKPGGRISAKIDYSDHYAHTDKKIGGMNFLQYSAEQWQRHNHDNHYQNRLRHGHFKKLFDESGYLPNKAKAADYEENIPAHLNENILCHDGDDAALSGYFDLQVPN